MKNLKNKSKKRKFIEHIKKVGFAALSFLFLMGPAQAIDTSDLIGQSKDTIVKLSTESSLAAGKEALNSALKVARGKPALSLATVIVCGAALPLGAAAGSVSLSIACGILIAKVAG